MIKWLRPSGTTIETAEGENIESFAKQNGWVRVNASDPLAGLESKEEVFNYVLDKTGISIDKRGSLDTVKAKASSALNGNIL